MYAPAVHDEITGLVNYVDQQLAAIRAAGYGLTEDELWRKPCRSALSVGGIIKHTAHGMRGAKKVLDAVPQTVIPDPAAFAEYLSHFDLAEGESSADVLAEFDAAREEYLQAIRAADPDADSLAPPAPWHGIFDARPIRVRYYLEHQVEEMARHAGHSDIIREQLDGVSVPALVMTLEGVPANDFFTPYQPAPGTIGAP